MTNDNHRNWEAEYLQLERRYNSLVKAVTSLEEKFAILQSERDFYKAQLTNAELNIEQQKTNLFNVVTNSNQTKDDMAAEIAELRAKLRMANNGNND